MVFAVQTRLLVAHSHGHPPSLVGEMLTFYRSVPPPAAALQYRGGDPLDEFQKLYDECAAQEVPDWDKEDSPYRVGTCVRVWCMG
jgi:hypothetical protein